MRKDSLHITDSDRELIRATIAAQAMRHVLVTHGTDSMVETARVLASIPDKTIVITGALVSIIPVIVVFLLLQRFWQGGLTAGAIK